MQSVLQMYRSSSYQENLYDAIANEKQYFNLLKAADEQTFKDQFEAEILLLLDEAQIKAYSRHSSLAERNLLWSILGEHKTRILYCRKMIACWLI